MIEFPTSPVLGQTYTYLGRTWVWNGDGWERQINAGQQVSVFTVTGTLVEITVTMLPAPIDGDWTQITYV